MGMVGARRAPLRARRVSRGRRACGGEPRAPQGVRVSAAAADVAERLDAEQLVAWEAAAACVAEATGADAVASSRTLAKAYGWAGQGFWRQEKVDEMPSTDGVRARIDFLSGVVGLDDAELAKVVKAFPEVLACDVEDRMQANLDMLAATYKMKPAQLKKAVLRMPSILGFNVDCEGTCIGECNRCWVRF